MFHLRRIALLLCALPAVFGLPLAEHTAYLKCQDQLSVCEALAVEEAVTGTLPSDVGNLINLKTLVIRDGALYGSLPTELGRLTKLEHLDLGNNSLTGTVPAELARLTALKRLRLEHNDLSGPLPRALDAQLAGLHHAGALLLSHNSGLCGPFNPALWQSPSEGAALARNTSLGSPCATRDGEAAPGRPPYRSRGQFVARRRLAQQDAEAPAEAAALEPSPPPFLKLPRVVRPPPPPSPPPYPPPEDMNWTPYWTALIVALVVAVLAALACVLYVTCAPAEKFAPAPKIGSPPPSPRKAAAEAEPEAKSRPKLYEQHDADIPAYQYQDTHKEPDPEELKDIKFLPDPVPDEVAPQGASRVNPLLTQYDQQQKRGILKNSDSAPFGHDLPPPVPTPKPVHPSPDATKGPSPYTTNYNATYVDAHSIDDETFDSGFSEEDDYQTVKSDQQERGLTSKRAYNNGEHHSSRPSSTKSFPHQGVHATSYVSGHNDPYLAERERQAQMAAQQRWREEDDRYNLPEDPYRQDPYQAGAYGSRYEQYSASEQPSNSHSSLREPYEHYDHYDYPPQPQDRRPPDEYPHPSAPGPYAPPGMEGYPGGHPPRMPAQSDPLQHPHILADGTKVLRSTALDEHLQAHKPKPALPPEESYIQNDTTIADPEPMTERALRMKVNELERKLLALEKTSPEAAAALRAASEAEQQTWFDWFMGYSGKPTGTAAVPLTSHPPTIEEENDASANLTTDGPSQNPLLADDVPKKQEEEEAQAEDHAGEGYDDSVPDTPSAIQAVMTYFGLAEDSEAGPREIETQTDMTVLEQQQAEAEEVQSPEAHPLPGMDPKNNPDASTIYSDASAESDGETGMTFISAHTSYPTGEPEAKAKLGSLGKVDEAVEGTRFEDAEGLEDAGAGEALYTLPEVGVGAEPATPGDDMLTTAPQEFAELLEGVGVNPEAVPEMMTPEPYTPAPAEAEPPSFEAQEEMIAEVLAQLSLPGNKSLANSSALMEEFAHKIGPLTSEQVGEMVSGVTSFQQVMVAMSLKDVVTDPDNLHEAVKTKLKMAYQRYEWDKKNGFGTPFTPAPKTPRSKEIPGSAGRIF